MKPLFILSIIFASTFYVPENANANSRGAENGYADVYFDPLTKQPFEMESFVAIKASKTRKVAYRSNGCSCQSLVCGCCTGINLQQFNFNREGCVNFTYSPLDFSITMDMLMNEQVMFSNSVSAKNPPPFCIPFPVPYLPQVNFCARLFEIHTPGQNLHMCFNLETRIETATILVLKFDCMRMGADGFALTKPGQNRPPSFTTTETPVTDSDIYDEVTEIKYKHDSVSFANA